MAIFSRGRPAPGPPPTPESPASVPEISVLKERLEETAQHPLKRVSTADLSEEGRAVAEAINVRLDAVDASEKEQQ